MVRIKIENFARISKADIKLKPFTIFVGNNNSGKSYTAKLITLLFDSIKGALADTLTKGGKLEMYSEFLNQTLRNRLPKYFDVKNLNELIMEGAQSTHVAIEVPNKLNFSFTIEGNELMIDEFNFEVIEKRVKSFHLGLPPVHYIPSSRTALVKYSSLILSNEQTFIDALDTITNDFVFLLLFPEKTEEDEISDVAEKIERMINGKVILKDGDTPSIQYIQNNRVMDIRQTSSSVISLASLIIYIRHNVRIGDLLVVEEPELHLNQRLIPMLSGVFASLINRGVKVLITTNNYAFLPTINVLIEAKTNEKTRGELGITDDEVLDKENVGVYVFSKGVVEELEVTEQGMYLK